jgi:hypothetical protein
MPAYWFRSPASDAQFFTISEAGKQMLIDARAYVRAYKGIAFYAFPEGVA